jgi:hypothetical protein
MARIQTVEVDAAIVREGAVPFTKAQRRARKARNIAAKLQRKNAADWSRMCIPGRNPFLPLRW